MCVCASYRDDQYTFKHSVTHLVRHVTSQLAEISIKILYLCRLNLRMFFSDYTHTHKNKKSAATMTFKNSKGMYVCM